MKGLHKNQRATAIEQIIWIDVDQFYGIEYDDWPAQIAQVAMWLIDHQMNMKISEEFGEYFVRLPLKKSATIIHGNALRTDWESILSKNELSYILGNPPFIGYYLQNKEQKEDIDLIFTGVDGSGVMDYVACWYIKAAQYIQETQIKVAFVSTNSISQGEQVGILWKELIKDYNINIFFAHRTFNWSNEAKGKAAVHVVIIGFSCFDISQKSIYEYENIKGEPHEIKAKNINPYLVDAENVFITKRSKPLCNVPEMIKGSSPTDGGNFLLTDAEKRSLLIEEPKVKPYIKPFISAKEFLNRQSRWCLWLIDISPDELKQMPLIMERVEAVRQMRLSSKKSATKKWAEFPTLFPENRQPDSEYIVIPRVSSENRKYIPMGYFSKNNIVSDTCIALPKSSPYHFGVITSIMHMVWMKYTCGRLKSDYRYSNTVVYNNYPWPESPAEKQKKAVEDAAQVVLDARSQFPNSSLADLYDPLTMPPVLAKAHQELDKAVDKCYRPAPFESETKRIEYLFELYEKYTAGLFAGEGKKKKVK